MPATAPASAPGPRRWRKGGGDPSALLVAYGERALRGSHVACSRPATSLSSEGSHRDTWLLLGPRCRSNVLANSTALASTDAFSGASDSLSLSDPASRLPSEMDPTPIIFGAGQVGDRTGTSTGSTTLAVRSTPKRPTFGSLSVGELRAIMFSRPPPRSGPAPSPPAQEVLEPRCIACAGNFCCSRAKPHGPDGRRDNARYRRGVRRPYGRRPQSEPSLHQLSSLDDSLAGAQLPSPFGGNSGIEIPERPATVPALRSGALGATRKEGGSRPLSAITARAAPSVVMAAARRLVRSGVHDTGSRKGDDDDSGASEAEGGSARSKSPGGAGGRGWRGASSQATRDKAKSRNPFVEYDSREKRLQQERRRLLLDVEFMQERRNILQRCTLHNKFERSIKTDDDLHDERVFFGPYSMGMKSRRGGPVPKQRIHTTSDHGKRKSHVHSHGHKHGHGHGNEAKGTPEKDPTQIMKAMQRQLHDSSEAVQRALNPEKAKANEEPCAETRLRMGLSSLLRKIES